MELKQKYMLGEDFLQAKAKFDELVIDIFNGERAISYSALKTIYHRWSTWLFQVTYVQGTNSSHD